MNDKLSLGYRGGAYFFFKAARIALTSLLCWSTRWAYTVAFIVDVSIWNLK